MRLSSIDDVVEHWMFDASTRIARVGDGCRRIGLLLVLHRRTIALIALIVVGSLFTLPFLLALLGVPLVFGFVSAWTRQMTQGDQA